MQTMVDFHASLCLWLSRFRALVSTKTRIMRNKPLKQDGAATAMARIVWCMLLVWITRICHSTPLI
jgi:hypothetical protein